MSLRPVQYLTLENMALFGLVGAIGFLIDTIVLYAIKDYFGLYPARLCSFLTATIATWLLNRALTFRKQRSGLNWLFELLCYLLLMLVGGIVNYLTFWAATTLSLFIYHHPVFGVAIGSLAGLFFNFISARVFVFNKARSGH